MADEKQVPAERAMTLALDPSFTLSLEPRTIEEAYRLAGHIAKTRLCGVLTAEDALTRVLAGRELGLPAMTSLRWLFTVEGKLGMMAEAMLALCLNRPQCEYFDCVETDDVHATFKAKRVGRTEKVHTFHIDEAKRAGLLDRGEGEKAKMNNWNRWPSAMCRARCIASLARMVFPDVIGGLLAQEEMDDEPRRAPPNPNEMIGEVVPQAPVRDYAAETAAVKAEMKTIKNREERAALRKKIEGLDLPAPFMDEIKTAWNELIQPQKAAPQAPPGQQTL